MEKSRIAAAFLALFAGSIGLHKFYLRDTGAGIFYIVLMFMTSRFFPVSTMLGLFDAIHLFSMSEETFDRKYNKNIIRQESSRKPYPSQNRRRRDMKMGRERYDYKKNTGKRRDNPFKRSAEKKYKEYDLEDALEDYNHALEITPEDKEIHFNLAAIHSLLENKEKSFNHLEEAVRLGFSDKKKILSLDDLAYLRIQEEFEAFKNNGFSSKETKGIEAPGSDLLQDDLLLSQLKKLKDLRSRGLLSQKEFNYEKEKLFRK